MRALAITLVVTYHVVRMGPLQNDAVWALVQYGQHGVDLFFVLSGWLIGGLYWRELERSGNVRIRTFLARRWFRTIPPYVVALALAWAAVFAARREPFDPGYLVFLQNYYPAIPFFLVSWSLCIEEHFYVLLPLSISILGRSGISANWLFALLFLAAPIGRLYASQNGLSSDFGFQWTATHLRLEGLVLGFWAARLPMGDPAVWRAVRRLAGPVCTIAAIMLVATAMTSPLLFYRVGLSLIAICATAGLIWLVDRNPGRIASSRLVGWIALSSYSIYLTHALTIHLARAVMDGVPALPAVAYYPLVLLLIAGVAWIFFVGVERTSITLRERWFGHPVRRP